MVFSSPVTTLGNTLVSRIGSDVESNVSISFCGNNFRMCCRVKTTSRRNRSVQTGATARNLVPGDFFIGSVDLDSHADTTVFEKNFLFCTTRGVNVMLCLTRTPTNP